MAARKRKLHMAGVVAYWFWQGENGAELNYWRMK